MGYQKVESAQRRIDGLLAHRTIGELTQKVSDALIEVFYMVGEPRMVAITIRPMLTTEEAKEKADDDFFDEEYD